MPGHPSHATSIEFDEGNESELAAHDITPMEVVQMLNNDPEWARNKRHRAGVWKAIGRTDGGRAITVPVTYDDVRSTVRPVTGWDCTPGERTKYLGGR